MGETLVCCVQAEASPEKRDAWTILPSEHTIPYSDTSTELLIHTLDELLHIYKDPHPNLRQVFIIKIQFFKIIIISFFLLQIFFIRPSVCGY